MMVVFNETSVAQSKMEGNEFPAMYLVAGNNIPTGVPSGTPCVFILGKFALENGKSAVLHLQNLLVGKHPDELGAYQLALMYSVGGMPKAFRHFKDVQKFNK